MKKNTQLLIIRYVHSLSGEVCQLAMHLLQQFHAILHFLYRW